MDKTSPSHLNFQQHSDATVADLPRQLLRHLLIENGISVGSRILVVGCGRGRLAGDLCELGIDVTGFDESAENIAEARRSYPKVDFVCEQSTESILGTKSLFDLVIVQNNSVYQQNLFSSSAFSTSTHFFSALNPGSSLVFLNPIVDQHAECSKGHDVSCFARHLSFFPGSCKVTSFPSNRLRMSIQSLVSHEKSVVSFRMASLQIPSRSLTLSEWLTLGDIAAGYGEETCCSHANRIIAPEIEMFSSRRAA